MKAVLQRVSNAEVAVDGEVVGKIGTGFLVLLGVEKGDTEKEADAVASKIAGLRIFKDEEGKMNLNLSSVGGEILCISNFTLCADYSHGFRPSFFDAEAPDRADELYKYFMAKTEALGIHVEKGIFGADMKVSLLNDGPVTIIIDSERLKKK